MTGKNTTEWVARNLATKDGVTNVQVIGPNTLHIERSKHPAFSAAIVSAQVVDVDTIESILEEDSSIEIVANVPKEAIWSGEAITLAKAHHAAFGSLYDLYRCLSSDIVRAYVRPEFDFVERGLLQHDMVAKLERRFDRVYRVHRHGLPPVQFVMLKEYELTADHVRTARSRYGKFDIILINDPNGKPTSDAVEAASALGMRILMWRQLLGRLNSE